MKRAVKALVLVLVLAAASGAGAQELTFHPWQVGITGGTLLRMGLELSSVLLEDAWIGVLLHPTRSLALRPSLVFAWMAEVEEDRLTPASERTGGLAVGGALGGFYYFPVKAGLSIYAGPEIKYYYRGIEDYYPDGDRESLRSWHLLQLSVLFGAQYMLSERFGFQADLGAALFHVWSLGRRWHDVTGDLTDDRLTENTTFTTRGAYLGAVFYLN